MAVPESRQGTRQSMRDETGSIKNTPQRISAKLPSIEPPKVSVSNNDLMDGAYDEEANAAAFQQALNAWRGVKTEEVKQMTKSVRFHDEP